MSHLWSPWRMEYINNRNDSDQCPFCLALEEKTAAESLIIIRGENAFVMLNRYPYTSGHLLVLPYSHQEKLSDLDPEIRSELMELIQQSCLVSWKRPTNRKDLTSGLNLGEAAGAGLPKHLHWHVVPRWPGDTNYMTAVGGVRVIPEALEDTLRKISQTW